MHQILCEMVKKERKREISKNTPKIMVKDIVPLINIAWSKAMTKENIQQGFKRAGIYPYNPEAYLENLPQHSPSSLTTTTAPTALQEIATTIKQHPAVKDVLPAPIVSLLPIFNTNSGDHKDENAANMSHPNDESQEKKRRKRKMTIDTSGGLLLTSDEVRAKVMEMNKAEEDKKNQIERKKKLREEKKITAAANKVAVKERKEKRVAEREEKKLKEKEKGREIRKRKRKIRVMMIIHTLIKRIFPHHRPTQLRMTITQPHRYTYHRSSSSTITLLKMR